MSTKSNSDPSALHPRRQSRAIGTKLANGVRGVAFWAAVLLPFLALTALYADSISLPTIGGIVTLNALCAVLGHDYS